MNDSNRRSHFDPRADAGVRDGTALESLTGGHWVIGVSAGQGDAQAVIDALVACRSAELNTAPPPTLIWSEPERRASGEAGASPTLIVATESGAPAETQASPRSYRLRAITPADPRDRRKMLRTRDEALSAASDLLVVCTDLDATPFPPGLFTLRIALAQTRPIVWLLRQGGQTTCRLSIAPEHRAPSEGPRRRSPSYATRVERLMHLRDSDPVEHWLDEITPLFPGTAPDLAETDGRAALGAWWKARVRPVLDADAAMALTSTAGAPGSGVEHAGNPGHGAHRPDRDHDGQGAASITAAHDALRWLRDLNLPRDGLARWLGGIAGAWHLLLNRAIAQRFAGWRGYVSGALKPWWRALWCGPSLNRAQRDFEYRAGQGDPPYAGFSLADNAVAGRAFDLADERANIDSGRYRSAMWLGYLLSAVAVMAASVGALQWTNSASDAHAAAVLHAHDDALPITWGAVWVAAIAALTIRFMSWARADPRKAVYLCLSTVILAAVGGGVLAVLGAVGIGSVVEIVALVLILALVRMVWSLGAHENWLAARTLAEALRYDHLLRPALGASRVSSHGAFRIEGDRLALVDGHAWWLARLHAAQPLPEHGSAWSDRTPVSLADRGYLIGYIAHVLRQIDGQIAYHVTRQKREHRIGHRLHRATTGCFGGAAVCAALHAVHVPGVPAWVSSTLVFCTVALPVTGAALHAVRSNLELERHARASAGMREVLVGHRSALQAISEEIAAQPADAESTVPWRYVAEVRSTAALAADAMMSDVAGWHQLVAAQAMPLPT